MTNNTNKPTHTFVVPKELYTNNDKSKNHTQIN